MPRGDEVGRLASISRRRFDELLDALHAPVLCILDHARPAAASTTHNDRERREVVQQQRTTAAAGEAELELVDIRREACTCAYAMMS